MSDDTADEMIFSTLLLSGEEYVVNGPVPRSDQGVVDPATGTPVPGTAGMNLAVIVAMFELEDGDIEIYARPGDSNPLSKKAVALRLVIPYAAVKQVTSIVSLELWQQMLKGAIEDAADPGEDPDPEPETAPANGTAAAAAS